MPTRQKMHNEVKKLVQGTLLVQGKIQNETQLRVLRDPCIVKGGLWVKGITLTKNIITMLNNNLHKFNFILGTNLKSPNLKKPRGI